MQGHEVVQPVAAEQQPVSSAQLKYADRRGYRLAVIVGDDEWESGKCQLKDLSTKESTEVTLDELPEAVRRLLS